MSGYLYFPKLQNHFQINDNTFQRKPQLIATYPLYFTILGLYLKQYLFQNKLLRTGLEPC